MVEQNTFFRGANLGGSRITKSHVSFLDAAPFMNSVASSFRNEIFAGSSSLRIMFSLAISKAGSEESTPAMIKKLVSLVLLQPWQHSSYLGPLTYVKQFATHDLSHINTLNNCTTVKLLPR